ncbi:class I SAM-dependent DNA methyltransferase [Roseofilum capinflatum]|uniref:Class I SAM-dependent methyltransferase n=1 Tax=Roseofilum capinflatum BLCC-M114 TaxID=3022440 RepID=A0ABT7B4Y0_9CYAN|nr:class I SAM-dependent methyltransferase [Roseofilum capinflatum]MDJ1173872.1 class I SAM-dependent methyltransferase [Roseofilum capinflatum BLCC-M114]
MENVQFDIRIPQESENSVIQEEFVWLKNNGEERKIKLHDYPQIYRIPFLYEHLMEKLQAQSHTILSSLLAEQVTQAGGSVEDLVVLEVGAGSGMFGKALADLGIKSITGIDIVPEALDAVSHTYPGVYENYYIEDLSNLSETTHKALSNRGFNCIVCGSALGFNHIPASAWATAYNMVAPHSWIAFNVQKERWEDTGANSFSAWHPWVAKEAIFKMEKTHEYQHRFYLDGRSLIYVAIMGRKKSDILAN